MLNLGHSESFLNKVLVKKTVKICLNFKKDQNDFIMCERNSLAKILSSWIRCQPNRRAEYFIIDFLLQKSVLIPFMRFHIFLYSLHHILIDFRNHKNFHVYFDSNGIFRLYKLMKLFVES